jgi:hypothetical protein
MTSALPTALTEFTGFKTKSFSPYKILKAFIYSKTGHAAGGAVG